MGRRTEEAPAPKYGGSWKLAYADYVTAMMAFFLLMWLLSSPKPSDLAGLADYFTKTTSTVKQSAGQSPSQADSPTESKGGGLSKNLYGEKDVPKRGSINMKEVAKAELEKQRAIQDQRNLERLKEVIQKMIDESPQASQYKDQIKLENSVEGLLIQLVDGQNRPMFDSGSSTMKPYAVEILTQISRLLSNVPNKMMISGHTDSTPFGRADGYGNWELSADRANSSRREMVKAGTEESKVVRVVGMSSTTPLLEDSTSAANRRIEILVLTKKAEVQLLKNQIIEKVGS